MSKKVENKLIMDPREVGEMFRGLGTNQAEEEALNYIAENALRRNDGRTNQKVHSNAYGYSNFQTR